MTLGRNLEYLYTFLVTFPIRQYGRCATAIMDRISVNALEPKFDSGSGHCDYTESLLPLLRGVLEMRVGGGGKKRLPSVTEWQREGVYECS